MLHPRLQVDTEICEDRDLLCAQPWGQMWLRQGTHPLGVQGYNGAALALDTDDFHRAHIGLRQGAVRAEGPCVAFWSFRKPPQRAWHGDHALS